MTEQSVSAGDLARAAEVLASGGVVGVPTDTVYGLAIDPRSEGAASKLFSLKARPQSVPLPVLIGEPGDAAALAVVDERARALFDSYWPGPLTVVLRRRPGVVLHLGGDPGSVGLRCPLSSLTRGLIALSGPLAVTSANRHGDLPAQSAGEVRALFGSGLELVLDGGRCDGEPSTVVSLLGSARDGDEVECLRRGAVPMEEIEQVMARVARGGAPPPRGPATS